MAKFPLNLSKNCRFRWFFYADFHKFASVAGVGLQPPNPLQMHISKFSPKIRKKFKKIFETIAKFSWKLLKNCKFFIDFYKFFENFSCVRSAPPAGTPHAATPPPYKPSLGGPRFPPEKFTWALLVLNHTHSKIM